MIQRGILFLIFAIAAFLLLSCAKPAHYVCFPGTSNHTGEQVLICMPVGPENIQGPKGRTPKPDERA